MDMQKNRPNQVFDDGKVFIGELKTYQDADNLLVKKVWCVCNAQSSFEKYKRKGCRLFFVDNREGNDMCYTLIVAYPDGKLVFWDMDDTKIEGDHIDGYLETFSEEAKGFLSTLSQNMKNDSTSKTRTNESSYKPKHILGFDEFAILEKYEVYGHGIEFVDNNGISWKSVVSLKDDAGGTTHIVIDDGCYLMFHGSEHRENYRISSYIFPEAHAALKDLPTLPVR